MSDAAITSIVSGVITVTTIVVGFLAMWVKLRYGAEQAKQAKEAAEVMTEKIEDNTTITRAGLKVAATDAKAAVTAVTEARAAAEQMGRHLDKKLNGGLDHTIANALDPIKKALEGHAGRIEELEKYSHERNHAMLDVLNEQSLKMDLLIETIKKGR